MNFKKFSILLLLIFSSCFYHYVHNEVLNVKRDNLDLVAEDLHATINELSTNIGERNLYHPERLRLAATWIEKQFHQRGFSTVSRLPVAVDGKKYLLPSDTTAWNLEVQLDGLKGNEDLIVLGAHYDTKVGMKGWHDHWPPKPEIPGTPGANDNGSGVAALLWLASELSKNSHHSAIRFVAFVNEEPPFFQTPAMGSFEYAKNLRQSAKGRIRMISLETLGCYSSQPRTKRNRLVSIFGLKDKSDYVALLGNFHSKSWMKKSSSSLSKFTTVEVRTLALPEFNKSVAWSDDWSFWQLGIPAFSVTDTAYLRSDVYHETTDTPEKIDYKTMADVVSGLKSMIEEMEQEK